METNCTCKSAVRYARKLLLGYYVQQYYFSILRNNIYLVINKSLKYKRTNRKGIDVEA